MTGADQANSGVITDETKLPPPVKSLCGFDTGELERKWNEPTKNPYRDNATRVN